MLRLQRTTTPSRAGEATADVIPEPSYTDNANKYVGFHEGVIHGVIDLKLNT